MNILNAVSESWWSFVFHASWQSAVVAAVLLGVVWGMRRLPAPLRYGLLLVALVKFAVPPVIGVSIDTPWMNSPQAALPAALETEPAPLEVARQSSVPAASTAQAVAAVPSPQPAGTPPSPRETPQPRPVLAWRSCLLLFHMCGTAAALAFLFYSFLCLHQLTRQCRPLDSGPVRERFDQLRARLGMRDNVDLLVAPGDLSPMAIGVFRRRIIVPESLLNSLNDKQIDVIFSHELAHHSRWDTWCIALENVLLAVWWFHPMFWVVLRSLRSVREDCCDDLLLETGVTDDDTYCESLLRAAAMIRRPGMARAALGFADRFHPLGRRLRRIMDISIARRARLSFASAAGLLLLALCVAPGVRLVGAQSPAGETPRTAAAIIAQAPGALLFDSPYQHGERGTARQIVKRADDGTITAVADMTLMKTVEVAVGSQDKGLTSYEIHAEGYDIVIEFEPGKATVTRRGVREDWDKKVFEIPQNAFFDPNSRPDSYCAAQVYSRILPAIPEGQTQEFDVYDWDNSGNAFGFYRISLTNAGPDVVDVPAGKFIGATHIVLRQLSSGGTWFKKREGHVTDFWVLTDGTILRILRQREPYELQLRPTTTPPELPNRVGPSTQQSTPVTQPPQSAQTAESIKQVFDAPTPAILEKAPGQLTFDGLYRHKSRGQAIDVPEHRWVKRQEDGSVAAACDLPFMKSLTFAEGGRRQGFTRYENRSAGRDGGPGYELTMEFEPGKVFVTRRGVRGDWDRKEFSVPARALFDPNSRPDPYCAIQVLERLITIPGGSSEEIEAYDWDNTGDALAFYRIRATNAGYDEVTVPCGRFKATHVIIEQLTSADTWFKKRAGHLTDMWVLTDGTIIRILRHREPYEIELLEWKTPETLPGLIERTAPQLAMPPAAEAQRVPLSESDRIPGCWSPRGFIMPFDATVYLTPIRGEAGGVTELGIGTSQAECRVVLRQLPNSPEPSGEVKIGDFKKGDVIPFCLKTTWQEQAYWVSTSEDTPASQGSFQDTDGKLGLADKSILEQTGPTTWLIHFDDANSYKYDDDDNDIPIIIRLEKQ